mmetsp:Transcript_1654/g.2582  ORF Transcript_1654/g.2582 Transcript_1654/m.2582 type:complete len:796 (-) Transcript_1654:9975-12362(-)|eukprot:CAMPEP_0203762750 /NCGR_PEP_ID=MMETSP0098-20131031/15565_1 /ASSEMBLY_ACC=CAM_ASM_000208 /TAXON_ID=96639 /ORGANISM=" , Strain NY0313808BC1" /LENGTH=795 /DNA_ID=CAMNT_0050657281 /DNA_START=94 /DNA_END=2478 /DNA_ORIENTATION=-
MAFPKKARTVIVGGGIAGLNTAFHLAEKGCSDVVLVEKHKLTSGTTWHAAGLLGRIGGSRTTTKMRVYSQGYYARLAEETGMGTGFHQYGGVAIATNPDRLEMLKRSQRVASLAGVDCKIISPEEVRERAPLINCEDVLGGLWNPLDGQINPVDVSMVVAAAAKARGVQIFEETEINQMVTDSSGASVVGVKTSKGDIECDNVVLCGGMWSWQLAAQVGAFCPLWPCEHEYFLTESIPEARGHPVVRSHDEAMYIKEDAGKLLIGLFEPNAKIAFRDQTRVPDDFFFGSFPDDFDHYEPYLMQAMHRVPKLENHGIAKYFSGPESFTPDGREMIGESPDIANLYLCTGFNSAGIVLSPAVTEILAELVLSDNGTNLKKDIASMDISRYQAWMNDADFVKARASETLGREYVMVYPYQEYSSGRDMHKSAFHEMMQSRDAKFGQAPSGIEVPLWFGPAELKPSWGEQMWYPYTRNECQATRKDVGVFDLSSSTKVIVNGADAEKLLQSLSTSDVESLPEQHSMDTLFLNYAGRIKFDCTLSRLGADSFLLSSANGCVKTKLIHWLTKFSRKNNLQVALDDLTYKTSTLGLFGPNATNYLTKLCPKPEKQVAVLNQENGDTIIVLSSRAVGEHGYEIIIPHSLPELPKTVYQKTIGNCDVTHCGKYASEAMRMEAGMKDWGRDFTESETPAQVGLLNLVDNAKTGFLGKIDCDEQHTTSLETFVVSNDIHPGNPLIFPEEPIYNQNDEPVGLVCASSFGFSFNVQILYAHVEQGVENGYLVVRDKKLQLKRLDKPLN